MDKEEYQRICQLQKTHWSYEEMRRAIVRNGILPIRASAFGLIRGRHHVALHTRYRKPSDRGSN